jgi:hypothetical protein
MDAGTKTYQIDKHKQLIPLNGNTPHFSCFFEVKSKDKKPFNLSIVEQGEIKPKQYKLVDDGYINGQIESDGQLKSYFLVLKSQQPCECDVRIILKSKEPGITPPLSQTNDNHIPPQQELKTMVVQNPESYFQLKYIIGISIAIIVIYLLYRYRSVIFGKNIKRSLIPSNTSF